MKSKMTLFTCLIFIASTLSAQWTEISPIPGNPRHHPINFSIDGFGYVVTGANDPSASAENMLDDFYRFDPEDNSWTKLPDFPGPARGFGVGLAHNGKGYIGFGINEAGDALDDLWEFDPATGAWKELQTCSCAERWHPAFVAVDGKIFVGQGSSPFGNLRDWWEYDIATNSWDQKNPVPGVARHHPYYFAIDGIAYTMFGHSSNAIHNDVYAYDYKTDQWTQKNTFPSHARVAGTHFEHNGKGYVMAGDNERHRYDEAEFWEYDPTDDSWIQKETLPADGRWAPGSFVVDNKAYFFAGLSRNTGEYHNDVWEYPLEINTDTEKSLTTTLELRPNPASTFTIIQTGNVTGEVEVFSVTGQLVYSRKYNGSQAEVTIPLSSFAEGLYSVVWTTEESVASGQIIKVKE